jgi:AcrR family transcriptional regulator
MEEGVPRFGKSERELIRETLLDRGNELFSRFGLKKTTVEELAAAAGIAKGTFYHFFGSKEELCFDVLKRDERVRKTELNGILASRPSPRRAIGDLLDWTFAYVKKAPLVAGLKKRGELDLLLRKIPREKKTLHFAEDVREVSDFLRRLPGGKSLTPREGRIVTGLFQAVALLLLHEEDIGMDVFPAVTRLLRHCISSGLTGGKGGSIDLASDAKN